MARTTIRTEDITASEVTTAKMATDPTNASNLSSGSVPTAQLGNVNTSGLEDDIALLGFKVASNGSLAKYNLVDQTVDDFQDATGVNAGGSTNEIRDSSGKYYFGGAAGDATGGTITESGGKTIHSFTSSGTFTVPGGSASVEYLVIAGGGGGGALNGGRSGGGAGGYRCSVVGENSGGGASAEAVLAASTGSYTVTIGAGGSGSTAPSSNGSNSVFGAITSIGGGGAGSSGAVSGGDGGSGGAKIGGAPAGGTAGSGTVGQGYDGGSGGDGVTVYTSGGGGGGAGGVGETVANGPGDGGIGVTSSITGGSVARAGGGSACSNVGFVMGDAVAGGGSNSVGTANTGGGGSGLNNDGGSGIVIASYTTDAFVVGGSNLTLVSTTTAAQAAPTKGDIVFTYTNGAGSTTLGTDVTAEISADGGSTWTAMTLGSEGSTGSHNIATSHDVTITSTITAPWNMAYRIKTLNQSASKTTRIQAVSLGWS